jgi:hypothetical protein
MSNDPAAMVSNPRSLRVFLCHSSADKPAVRELYQRLKADGCEPWLDEEDILPGQDWQREIPKAVRASDVVIVCLSRGSVNKAGYIQKEITFALDIAEQQFEDSIFIIPVKLEECEVPERLNRWQWVSLFNPNGYGRLIRALNVRSNEIKLKGSPARLEQTTTITQSYLRTQAKDNSGSELSRITIPKYKDGQAIQTRSFRRAVNVEYAVREKMEQDLFDRTREQVVKDSLNVFVGALAICAAMSVLVVEFLRSRFQPIQTTTATNDLDWVLLGVLLTLALAILLTLPYVSITISFTIVNEQDFLSRAVAAFTVMNYRVDFQSEALLIFKSASFFEKLSGSPARIAVKVGQETATVLGPMQDVRKLQKAILQSA